MVQDARFGLFVHWGSTRPRRRRVGDEQPQIPIADYEKLPAQFNPVMFDPVEWVAMAKRRA
jgi:alpha-L-fucosidase